MPKNTFEFILTTNDKQHSLKLTDVEYLGNGVYTCEIQVNSNGFMCKRIFGFDNDEYFLAKINAMLNNKNGEASLMDMQEDSFLRFKYFDDNTIQLTGYLVEQTEVTHSMEFSFNIDLDKAARFVKDFEKMVRVNI